MVERSQSFIDTFMSTFEDDLIEQCVRECFLWQETGVMPENAKIRDVTKALAAHSIVSDDNVLSTERIIMHEAARRFTMYREAIRTAREFDKNVDHIFLEVDDVLSEAGTLMEESLDKLRGVGKSMEGLFASMSNFFDKKKKP